MNLASYFAGGPRIGVAVADEIWDLRRVMALWLFTIERRLLMDRRRSEKRRPPAVEIQEQDVATEFDPLDDLIGQAQSKFNPADFIGRH